MTFDDRSPALHVSIPRTSDNDTRQSQHSVLHHAHQARPRPRPGDFFRLRNSPTPCQHAQCYPDRLSEIFVSQMIYCQSSEQTMQIFSPGLVPGHCTDDWVLPSPKIKTVRRGETLFVQSLASLIRELIIWIRKRDPSTEPLSAITTIFAGSEFWASRCLHQCQCHDGLRITKHKTFYLIPS